MTLVQQASLCDTCGARSVEHSQWLRCCECFQHTCPACDVSIGYLERATDTSGIRRYALCKACNERGGE